MTPIKTRRELQIEGYLYACGLLVAIALITPIARNIAGFWKGILDWAIGISIWLGMLCLILFACSLPGMGLMAGRAITAGVEPIGAKINEYFKSRTTTSTEVSVSKEET